MKIKYYIQTALLCLLLFASTACNDWLNISPRTEIKAEKNFKDEQGYKDALTGVYLLMTDESLYGQDLTFGFLDVLAQYYTGIYNTSNAYYYAKNFDFSNLSNVARFSSIWMNSYNVIANINELIQYVDKADSILFTGRNYNLIKGEAHGLRAFMHFDLVRMYGPGYQTGADTKAIPYVTEVSTKITPLSTVEQVLTQALADLAIAEKCLQKDPVVNTATSTSYDTEYERDRTFKFNYFAVKMLEARIYLYKKDYTNALAAAQKVIGQTTFHWTPLEEINTADTKQRNLVFSEELVFALYTSELNTNYTSYFTGTTSGLYMLEENYNALYQLYQSGTDHDTRYEYQSALLDQYRFSTKLKQQASNTSYLFRMPMMRLSEAYYIAAECAMKQNDLTYAVSLLNTVRESRQISAPLSETLTADQINTEIFNEYSKEFFAEGQLFYYYKRLNYPYIPIRAASGSTVTTTYVTPTYIFPLPDDEKEYGGRNNE